MKTKEEVILIAFGAVLLFTLCYMASKIDKPPVKCTGLQIIDCGHIVHNGDTLRFTTLPVK